MKSFLILVLFVGLVVGTIGITAALIPKSPFLPGMAILEFGILLYGFFYRFARENVFQCEHCNSYFALAPISDIMAIKGIDTRLVKCPACGEANYNRSFPRREVQTDIIEPPKTKRHGDENWAGFYIQVAVVSIVYIICVVSFGFLWKAIGYLGVSPENIQRGLLAKLSTISAGFFLYLAIFISAIRLKYKTGIYLAVTVIFSVLVIVILLLEYSRFQDLKDMLRASDCL
jgi:hypothetical protein